MFELLNLVEAVGQALAQLILGGPQGGLGGAFGVHLGVEANDGGGLAVAALLDCLQALYGIGGPGLLHFKALMLAPEQQGQSSSGRNR